MALTAYPMGKRYTIISNRTANNYGLTLVYNQNSRGGIKEEPFQAFAGAATIHEYVDQIEMDDADYANISIQTVSDIKGFFFLLI